MKRRSQNETGSDRLSKNIPNVQLWQDVKNMKLWNILQDNGFADNSDYVSKPLIALHHNRLHLMIMPTLMRMPEFRTLSIADAAGGAVRRLCRLGSELVASPPTRAVVHKIFPYEPGRRGRPVGTLRNCATQNGLQRSGALRTA